MPFTLQRNKVRWFDKSRDYFQIHGGSAEDAVIMARSFAKSFYKSKEWKAVRSYVLKRDLYLCKCCGEPAEEVHHIIHLTPDNITDISVSLNPKNLVSLCKNCHFKEHKSERIAARCNVNNTDESEYVFDDNGYLVRKVPPVENF